MRQKELEGIRIGLDEKSTEVISFSVSCRLDLHDFFCNRKAFARNADQIVAFLTAANPNWSKKELTDMFYTHLKLTTDEVLARLEKDWDKDIRSADRNETHLIHMGDILTKGIVKQFPDKFK